MIPIICLIAGIWIGGWCAVLWNRRQIKLLRSATTKGMDRLHEVLMENHKLILELAQADAKCAQIQHDLMLSNHLVDAILEELSALKPNAEKGMRVH